jgi:hypothetical protein
MGAAARFDYPTGVAVDGNGTVYVADWYNYTVRGINPAGVVTTLGGLAGHVGSQDGTASTARFNQFGGVAVSGSGTILYVADTTNDAIRRGVLCPAGSLCLDTVHFGLSLSAKDPRTGASGSGLPIPQNDLFGFYAIPDLTGNPDNPEVFVKLLDGRAVNGKYWVFFGGLTDFEYTLTATDRTSSTQKSYRKDPYGFCGGADTSAFSKKIDIVGMEQMTSFIAVRPDIGAPSTESAGACVPSTEICLLEGKFALSLTAKDPRTGKPGSGLPIPQTDLFGFYAIPDLTGNPDNPEMFVKMLDGRPVNGKYWVFYGGLTDFEVTLTVRDTASGAQRTYTKQGGSFCGGADTTAF